MHSKINGLAPPAVRKTAGHWGFWGTSLSPTRVDGSAIHRLPSVVARSFGTAIPLDPREFLVQRTALNSEHFRGAGLVAAGLIQDAEDLLPLHRIEFHRLIFFRRPAAVILQLSLQSLF